MPATANPAHAAGPEALVTLTDAAREQITRVMARDGRHGLRIDLKKGGCVGMEYAMEYVAAADPGDHEVTRDGARVLLTPAAAAVLRGSVVDYESGLLESKFTFTNPNVKSACGCGTSVEFEAIPTL